MRALSAPAVNRWLDMATLRTESCSMVDPNPLGLALVLDLTGAFCLFPRLLPVRCWLMYEAASPVPP